jgi:hypothetical protein
MTVGFSEASWRLMMQFHFGSRQRRLFGNYEPAQENFGRARAVLLCHPMGNEQIFAYRTMRLLAARLVQAGFSPETWGMPGNIVLNLSSCAVEL